MDPKVDPAVITTIVLAVVYRNDGGSLDDIIDGFPVPPDRPTVERWVAALLEADLLLCESVGGEQRYFATDRAWDYVTPEMPAGGVDSMTSPASDPEAKDPAAKPVSGAPTPDEPAHTGVAGGVQSGAGSGVGPAANAPVSDIETQMKKAFEEVLPSIIIGIMPRPSAVAKLQQKAREALPESAQETFVQYGLGRLSHLILGDALRHKLQPPQYEIWRRQYFGEPTSAVQPESEVESAPAESVPPVESGPGVKRPKRAPRRGVEDIDSGALSGVEAVAKALEPILDAAARPASSAASQRSQSAWAGMSNAAAKAISRLLPGRSSGRKVVGAVTSLGALLFTALELIGCPTWLIMTLLGVGVTTAILIWLLRRNATKATPRSTATQLPTPLGSPRRKYFLAAGAVGLVIVVAGTIWYVSTPLKPSKADVSACLVGRLAPLPVRVAAIDLTFLRTGSAGCGFRYDAQIVTTAPLYQQLNTQDYLHAQAATEMAVIEAAASALQRADQGPGTKDQGQLAPRIAAIGPAPTPALRDLVLVRIETVPGKSEHIGGNLDAFWENGAWTFTLPKGVDPIELKQLGGTPKPANALVIDQPADVARLKALITEQAAYAAKVQAAATALAAEVERERLQKAAELEQQRQQQAADLARERQKKAADAARESQQKLTALNQLLQRGTFLSGVFVDAKQAQEHPVLLEVSACSTTTRQITLVLRNASGWNKARTGTGDWSIDADGETCTAKVWFSSNERIPGAGAPLDDTGSWYLTIHVSLDGTVTTETRGWDLRRVADADVAATKAEFGFATPAKAVAKESGVKDSGARNSDSTDASAPIVDAMRPTSGARGSNLSADE